MDEFKPTVSVVVPVYNGEKTIDACIESLLALDYPKQAYEIVIVENGSTDRTVEIIQRYPVRLLHSLLRGPAAARNLGIAHSTGEIIAFTDADCIADREWLTRLVEPYKQAETGGAGGAILAYQHSGRDVVEIFSELHSPLVNFSSGEGEFLPHLYTANASYRRSLLNRVNGFNARLIMAEDVDLAWRIQLQTGARLVYNAEAKVYHHHRSTRASLARQYRNYGYGEILLDTMYGDQPGYPRNRAFQVRRIAGQALALPRYCVSFVARSLRRIFGRASREDVEIPRIWFMIESRNILGKLEGITATRFMSDPRPAINAEPQILINRFWKS